MIEKRLFFLSYDQKHSLLLVSLSSKTSVSDPLVSVIFVLGSLSVCLSVFSSYIHIYAM